VVLKIIKHYQEEGQGNEVVQGVLLGLVVDDRLEITNCFPFPQHTEDDADFDEGCEDELYYKVLGILYDDLENC
ncbi:Eukaryotic translation initiation factor 3 subunit H, partial [Chelonia mydas]